MPGSTTNYAFNLPLVNDPIDADLWGGQLNANWTSLDTLLAAAGLKSTGFDDSVFRISDNADATKKLAFEVSGISTGTTRTLTVTDRSLAIPANAAGPSSLVLAEDTDNGANTATITAPSALAANRTYTLPDATGTIALERTATMEVLTSGTSWSVPANVSRVKYRMVGGGGGGGGSSATNCMAGGGGSGGYAEGYLTVTPGGTVAYTIGAGGTAGAAAAGNGGNGGATTLAGTITCNGGNGGIGCTGTGIFFAGGNGGTATGGQLNLNGEKGMFGFTNSGQFPDGLGYGGKNPLGTSDTAIVAVIGPATGVNGIGFGSGGSGGYGASAAGGAGAAGVIILEY